MLSSTAIKQELKKLYWKNKEGIRALLKTSFVDKAVLCKVRGLEIFVGVTNELEAFRAGTYSTKEPETLDWIDEYFSNGDIFFDVGANIGLYSIYAAKKKPGLRTFSFEPESLNFSRLIRNIVENKLSEKIIPLNIAVSGKSELGFLSLSRLEAGAALHSVANNPIKKDMIKEGVYCMTLDDLCFSQGLPIPNHLKIDVDGIEHQIVLSGAQKLIQQKNLKTVQVEMPLGDPQTKTVNEAILNAGFTFLREVVVEQKSKTANHLYARQP